MRRAFLVALALLAVAVVPLGGSALVVFRTSDRVVMGADSARTDQRGRVWLGCKMERIGPWWTSLVGYSGSMYPEPIDLRQIIRDALTPVSRLAEVEVALRRRVAPAIDRGLSIASKLPGFDRMFVEGGPVFALAVAGQDVDDPTVRAGLFQVLLHRREPWTSEAAFFVCPGPTSGWCDPAGHVRYATTVSDEPLMALLKARPAWVTRGDVAAVRRLIEAQIERTPREVTGPIEIVEISRMRGAHRISDSGSVCVP